MSKIGRDNFEMTYHKPFKVYTNEELELIDKGMKAFFVKIEISFPVEDTLTVFDYNRYMEEVRATKNGAIIIDNFIRDLNGHVDCAPIK